MVIKPFGVYILGRYFMNPVDLKYKEHENIASSYSSSQQVYKLRASTVCILQKESLLPFIAPISLGT